MSNPGELRERLRLTLYPVNRWVDIVRSELNLTEPKARDLLQRLEDCGKVIVFPDPDGIPRVAHAGNYSEDRAGEGRI